jgi:hypothetical protein
MYRFFSFLHSVCVCVCVSHSLGQVSTVFVRTFFMDAWQLSCPMLFQLIIHHGVTTPKTSTWPHVCTEISNLANSHLISTSFGIILCVTVVAVKIEFSH